MGFQTCIIGVLKGMDLVTLNGTQDGLCIPRTCALEEYGAIWLVV